MKALLQKEPQRIPPDALESAFETVERYTRHDAKRLAANACGVLFEKLSPEDAHELKTALGGQGYPCEVIDQSDLAPLPEPYKIRQCEATDEALVIYDMLDRPKPHPWDKVAVVAAGRIPMTEVERKSRTIGQGEQAWTKVTYTEKQDHRAVLDLLVVVGPEMKRFRAIADQFRMPHEENRDTAFGALIAAIAERATNAEKTQHIDAMGAGHFLGAAYERRAYHHEIMWRMYRWGWTPPCPSELPQKQRRPLRSGNEQSRKIAAAASGAIGGPLFALYAFGMATTWPKMLLCTVAFAIAGYMAPVAISGNANWR